MVGEFDRNLAYAKRDHAEVVAVDDAGFTRITFEDALVDETLRVRTLGGVVGGWCHCGAVADGGFVEIGETLDEGWRWVARHEGGGVVVGVADGDMAETVDDVVVVEDVVCCDEGG